MKMYPNVCVFRNEIQADDNKFSQRVMDKFHIQVLQDYRIAAAFVVGMLKTFAMRKGIVDGINYDEINEFAKGVLSECNAVLADESIFIMNGRRNKKASKGLEEAVKKASDAVAHAGNFCNNPLPLLLRTRDEFMPLAYQARELCDKATRRISYSLL